MSSETRELMTIEGTIMFQFKLTIELHHHNNMFDVCE